MISKSDLKFWQIYIKNSCYPVKVMICFNSYLTPKAIDSIKNICEKITGIRNCMLLTQQCEMPKLIVCQFLSLLLSSIHIFFQNNNHLTL
jgi:hypothetical protein